MAITGHFKDFIVVSLIIIVHELGHLTLASYYKWKIEKIVILPFGGITIFNENLNKPIKEEFLIAIFGPIYQILFYYFIKILNIENNMFIFYHYILLIFNLLPIYPLDGSKILQLTIEKFLPYKISNKINIYVSFVSVFILYIYIIYNKNLLIGIILFFLLIKVIKQKKESNYIFNKFLFERYLYNFKFSKTKIIKNIRVDKMMRDKKHIFLNKNVYISEKNILKDLFDR